MGSSFTRYRENGFWSRDASIELWLYLLAQEVRGLDEPPDWLRAAAEDWQLQATVGMVGCVSAGLDEYASTPARAAVIGRLAERALARLREGGEVLPAAWLNTLGLGGPGACFTRDVSTEVFAAVGVAFLQLLRGEVTWDAATSPVLYLVTRERYHRVRRCARLRMTMATAFSASSTPRSKMLAMAAL